MPSIIQPSFNDLVARSISQKTKIAADQIIILDNSDKYRPDGIKSTVREEDASLAAIFDTMAAINQEALSSATLCHAKGGEPGLSFVGALSSAADELVHLAQHRPVRYVELGPEPWKSKVILQQMKESGMNIQQYVGIDINPKSEETMRQALEPIVGMDRFTYWVSDFHQCFADTLPRLDSKFEAEGYPMTIITNLGFQEGNDMPDRLGPMLSQLTRPGDYVLSEMQVLADDFSSEVVDQFYHHPQMQRFSALVGQKFDANVNTSLGKNVDSKHDYLFHLVPVATVIGQVMVATTLFGVWLDAAKHYVLTNSCIKYTNGQFDQVRETCGQFKVRGAKKTGDASVVFQIAERV